MNNNTIHLPGNIDKKQVDGLDNIIDIIDNSIDNKISKDEYSKQYFTIEAITTGTVTIKYSSGSAKTISYSTDNGSTWISATTTSSEVSLATLSVGQKILFKGTNTTYSRGLVFGGTAQTKVYGNIMSLLYGDNFVGQTTLSDTFTFYYLFYNYTNLILAENLVLPATTLTSCCYYYMFYGCTSLTKAPDIPATTLASYCYAYMFQRCTLLTKAPELPATTLASGCYTNMFYGCTSLTKAPELPATTLASNCYYNMFYGCTLLTKAPELPTTTLSESCYQSMFQGCTSLTKAPELPATTLASYCYVYMFYNCTALIKAPELPATTLAESCYSSMFYNCTSLTKASELPATTLATYCYANMFQGCTSLTKAPELSATTLTESCYGGMFGGCTSLTKAPNILPAIILASNCYGNMFQGCTSLTKAPELPATTLANGCYAYMFLNCTLLNYIKALFTTTPSNSYTQNWLYGVASTGTFVKSDLANWTNTGTSAVPDNWEVYENSEYEVVRHYELTNDDQEHNYSQDYLTFVSLVDNNTISWKVTDSSIAKTISVSLDNGATWTPVTSTTSGATLATLSTNQKMLVKGSNTAYGNSSYYNYFTSAGNFNVEGNIMSLIYADNFIGQTSLDSAGHNFKNLFYQCAYLIDAVNLILPATTLTSNCYNGMFSYCSKLSRAPELPAPVLVDGCYASIFYSCLSLYYIRCLATDISATDCLLNWVTEVGENNVIPIKNSYIGIFVKADNMNSWTNYNGILSGWVVYNKSENIKHIKYVSNLNNLVKSKIINSNTSIIISPNKEHFIEQIYFNTLSNNTGSITFELDDPIFGIINNYNFHFSATYNKYNYTNPTLNVSMPSSITWASDPSFTWGAHYEINIRYNHLLNNFFGVCSSYSSITDIFSLLSSLSDLGSYGSKIIVYYGSITNSNNTITNPLFCNGGSTSSIQISAIGDSSSRNLYYYDEYSQIIKTKIYNNWSEWSNAASKIKTIVKHTIDTTYSTNVLTYTSDTYLTSAYNVDYYINKL